MIPYTKQKGALTFKVLVSPLASRSEIIGEHDGALRVRIAAPPVEGAANEELLRVLAKAFDVPRNAVEILSGHSSKRKSVTISGAVVSKLESLSR